MSKNSPYNTEQDNKDIPVVKENSLVTPITEFLQKKPEKIWGWMVAILILCIIGNILYSVFYHPKQISTEEALQNTEISIDPITEGLGKMVQAGTSINDAMSLKKDIDIILSKDSLSHQDSVQLLVLFQQLESINKKLLPVQNPKK